MKAMAQQSWAQGEPLELIELPTPEPGRDEIRVRVQAIGVNPVDWKMRSRGPLRIAAQLIGPPPPVVIGVDFAGIVEAVGAGIQSFQIGDPVVGGTDFSRKQRGSYADTVVVRADQLTELPPGFDMATAGALPVAGVTAWMCIVEQGHLQAGQKALILGASGGVGQFAVQFARAQRATTIGVCSTKNVDLVRALGADEVLDYTKQDALEQARAHGPFQVIVDCVGGYDSATCRALLTPGGRHLMIASESPLDALSMLIPPFSSRMVLGQPTGARLRHVVDAVASGAVKVAISERLPLLEAEKAHTLSQSKRLTGKIVLIP